MPEALEARPAVAPTPRPRRDRGTLFLGILIGVVLSATVVGGYVLVTQSGLSNRWFLYRNGSAEGVKTTASGLQYKVIKDAKGAKPTDSDVVLVNYVGKLTDGTVFDQSQQPTPMPVTGVVPGFSEAVKLMPKGAKYQFWIKPELGYGDKTSGPIPANSVLEFEIELLDFLPEAVVRQMQMQQQMMQGAAPPPQAAPQRQR